MATLRRPNKANRLENFVHRTCIIGYHIKLLSVLDFRLVPGMPLWQGGCMGPKWPETEVRQIIGAHPPEIGALLTPGKSHGTKNFGSKIFSYYPHKMLFNAFWRFVLQKTLKIKKNCLFLLIFRSFPYFKGIMQKQAVFHDFEHFLQNKSPKCIK